MKINNINDLNKIAKFLPAVVVADIDKRISDWLASGGKNSDSYIKQQFGYAENMLKAMGK
ncbi:MAG: hypothetical protein E7206_17855 [Clostridium beijerinckii]|nr:hypothetical protein [Clostridium beijerinckii]